MQCRTAKKKTCNSGINILYSNCNHKLGVVMYLKYKQFARAVHRIPAFRLLFYDYSSARAIFFGIT